MAIGGEQGVIGRCNFLGTADEERMTGFGEERPIGQDRIVLVVHRVLEEHVPVVPLAT
jgi:hypothetical protein